MKKTTSLPTITIVILTHQADERLNNSIASASWADKILILDNNTGNNWQNHRAKNLDVITIPFKIIDFSQARNLAWEKIVTDWVFFLDSDEIISPSLTAEIRLMMTNHTVTGMRLKRLDYFHHQSLHYGEVGNARFIRICRHGSGVWQGRVHETLKVEGKIINLTQPLQHYPHLSISAFVEKISYYAQLRSTEISPTTNFSLWQAINYPVFKFLVNFILKLGFLDGYRGLVYAIMMSIHSLSVRACLYEQQSEKNKQ